MEGSVADHPNGKRDAFDDFCQFVRVITNTWGERSACILETGIVPCSHHSMHTNFEVMHTVRRSMESVCWPDMIVLLHSLSRITGWNKTLGRNWHGLKHS